MSKKSEQPGQLTSGVEVTNISRHGFWLYLGGRELFVSLTEFPWFAEAPVGKITQVEWPAKDHLYWPALDIDLSVRSIEHSEEFPLKSVTPNSALHRREPARRSSQVRYSSRAGSRR